MMANKRNPVYVFLGDGVGHSGARLNQEIFDDFANWPISSRCSYRHLLSLHWIRYCDKPSYKSRKGPPDEIKL